MTLERITKAFSNGQFEMIYPFLSETIEWIVVGENHFIGKNAVIENCEQIAAYFKSVTTRFKTLHVIANDNKIVITGTAEFIRDNKRSSFIEASDLYEFNENNKLERITSYCITIK